LVRGRARLQVWGYPEEEEREGEEGERSPQQMLEHWSSLLAVAAVSDSEFDNAVKSWKYLEITLKLTILCKRNTECK